MPPRKAPKPSTLSAVLHDKPVERAPLGRDPVLHKAIAAQRTGDIAGALQWAKSALEDGDSAEARLIVAWSKALSGDLTGAISDCRVALSLDETSFGAHHDLAHYLVEVGELDEAFEHLEAAQRHAPHEPSTLLHFNIGRVCTNRGLLRRAAAAFRAALRLDPSFQPAVDGLMEVTEQLN